MRACALSLRTPPNRVASFSTPCDCEVLDESEAWLPSGQVRLALDRPVAQAVHAASDLPVPGQSQPRWHVPPHQWPHRFSTPCCLDGRQRGFRQARSHSPLACQADEENARSGGTRVSVSGGSTRLPDSPPPAILARVGPKSGTVVPIQGEATWTSWLRLGSCWRRVSVRRG